jgi:hypothetical protein
VNTSSTERWLPYPDLGLDDDLTPAPSGRTIRSFRIGLTLRGEERAEKQSLLPAHSGHVATLVTAFDRAAVRALKA